MGVRPSKKQLKEKGLYLLLLFLFLFLDSFLKLLNFCFFLNSSQFFMIPLTVKTTLFLIIFLVLYFIYRYEISRLKNIFIADLFYLILSCITFILFCETEFEFWTQSLKQTNLLFEGIKLSFIEFIYIFCFFSWKIKFLSLSILSFYLVVRFNTNDLFYFLCNFVLFSSIVISILLEERFQRLNFLTLNEGLRDLTKEKSFNSKITLINEKERSAISDKILDNVQEGVLVVDRYSNIIKMNDPLIKLFKDLKLDINEIVSKLMNSKIVTFNEAPEFLLNFVSPSEVHISPDVKSTICNHRDNGKRDKFFPKRKSRTSHLFQFEFKGKRTSRLNTYFGARLEGDKDAKNGTSKYNLTSNQSQTSSKNQGLNMPVRKAIELLAMRAEFFEEKEAELEMMTQQKNEDNYKINCDIFLQDLYELNGKNVKEISKYKFHLNILTTSFRDELRFIFVMKQKKIEIENRHLLLQNENKSKTLAFISHEMRTPLNCIVGMLACLENIIDPVAADKYVIPAIACGKHLMNLLNDLLDAAQIQAGKFKLVFVEFDLKSLLSDVLLLINIQAKPKGLELVLEWDNNLSHFVKSDPNRIRQIVINLLGNALKFTQKGSIRIMTEKNRKNNTLIHIKVIDTGLGIKEDSKRKLFTAFGKLDQDENEYLNSQGVGLGLLISNILAKNLGPSLRTLSENEINLAIGLNVMSDYGKGTQFEFIIENKNDTDLIDEAEFNIDIHDKNPKYHTKNPYFFKYNQFSNSMSAKLRSEKPAKFTYRSESEREMKEVNQIIVGTDPLAYSKDSSNNRRSENENHMKKSSKFLNKRSKSRSKEEILGSKSTFLYMSKDYDKRSLNNHNLLYDMVVSRGDGKLTRNLEDVANNEEKIRILTELNSQKKCDCPDLLICDDSQFNIVVLKAMLERYKFRIDSTFDGEEAVEKIENMFTINDCCKDYKMIFMDIEMPIKNGYETCAAIMEFTRKMACETPTIIATTGHSSKKEIKKILEAGMSDVLIKPILIGALVDMLVVKLFNLEKYPPTLYPGKSLSNIMNIEDRIREASK